MKKLLLISLITCKTLFGFTQVNVQDSLALVALYNSTDGPNWTCGCNQGWLTNPASGWNGITVENNRVVGVNLSGGIMICSPTTSCGLNGTIPLDIGQLTNLFELNLSNNSNLSGYIPNEITNLQNLINLHIFNCNLIGSVPQIDNLSSVNSIFLMNNKIVDLPLLFNFLHSCTIGIANNNLTFEDLEQNVNNPNISIYFIPQDSVNINIDTIINFNDTISFITSVGGQYNLYQWYHNNNPVSGANDSVYTINGISATDEGKYTCAVTNSIVPNLTLWRRTINLIIDSVNIVNSFSNENVKVFINDKKLLIHNSGEQSNLFIYSSDGKILNQILLEKNINKSIALNTLPKGTLLLRIVNKKNILTEKIVNY